MLELQLYCVKNISYPAGVVFHCKLILYVITMNYTCSILAIAKYTRPRYSYVYTQKYQAARIQSR